jgi:hypothetical protein
MTKARTGAAFAAEHIRSTAVPAKIKAMIEKIAKIGNEHWEYECDLNRPPYSMSQKVLAEFRDQFKEYWVVTQVHSGKAPKIVWFGNPKVATKYRTQE